MVSRTTQRAYKNRRGRTRKSKKLPMNHDIQSSASFNIHSKDYDNVSISSKKLKNYLMNQPSSYKDPKTLFLFKNGDCFDNFVFLIPQFFSTKDTIEIKQKAVKIYDKVTKDPESLREKGIFKTFRNGFGISNTNTLKDVRRKLIIKTEEYTPMFIIQKKDDVMKIWKYAGLNNLLRFVYYSHKEGFETHFDAVRYSGKKCSWNCKHCINNPRLEDKGYHTFITLNMYLDKPVDYDGGLLDVIPVKVKDKEKSEKWENAFTGDNKPTWVESDVKSKYSASKLNRLVIKPETGTMLMFGQGRVNGLLHQPRTVIRKNGCDDRSSSVCDMSKTKWLLRADVVYNLIYDGKNIVDSSCI